MREHENRYRKSRASTPSFEQRERYKKASDKRDATSKQMTYEDFLSETKDIDRLLDIDESSFTDKLREYKQAYAPRVRSAVGSFSARVITPARSKITYRPTKQHTAIGTLILSISIIGLALFGGSSDETDVAELESGEVASAVNEADISQRELDFTPAVPEGVSRTEDIKFDSSVGVANLRDTISGFPVTLSQQPLTDEQKIAPQTTLSEVAVALQAQVTLETNKGSAYVSTPAEEGDPSQTVVFVYNDLLFFMRTNGATISNEAFVEYINNIN